VFEEKTERCPDLTPPLWGLNRALDERREARFSLRLRRSCILYSERSISLGSGQSRRHRPRVFFFAHEISRSVLYAHVIVVCLCDTAFSPFYSSIHCLSIEGSLHLYSIFFFAGVPDLQAQEFIFTVSTWLSIRKGLESLRSSLRLNFILAPAISRCFIFTLAFLIFPILSLKLQYTSRSPLTIDWLMGSYR